MKKLSLIALACLMVLGLAQCKKNEPTNNNTADNGNRVSITLTLDNGGQRVHPEEENGLANVVYDNGDVVYVGSGGKYMGCLTYNGSVFAGSINAAATEGQPLQFILMGGQDFHGSLTENSTTEYTFNIGNQDNGLAVISCAPSNEDFSLTKLGYTAYLRNKCALVKFELGEVSTNAAITIEGMKTEATIGFDGTVTNCTATGDIATYGTGSTRYAVVLSDQAEVTEGTISAEGYTGTFSIPSAAYTNAFLTNATMTLEATSSTPTGVLNGLFSVSTTQQVQFSQGNLQYIGSAATPYWKFAEHQWDYFGTTTGQNSDSQTADRDLFGWGTSGYNHGATAYQPWATSKTYSEYYAYGNSSYHLYDQTGQADWGYNAIANGGNTENSGWRTLTTDEWGYVFNSRTGAASKWGHGNVNGVNGMILLPDDWTLPEGLSFTSGNSSWANVYNAEQWAQMEANGAVFLPAASYRSGTSLTYVGLYGSYWSNSYSDSNYACCVDFYSGNLYPQSSRSRYCGCSVRLVRNAE